jgi:hypothetical protein
MVSVTIVKFEVPCWYSSGNVRQAERYIGLRIQGSEVKIYIWILLHLHVIWSDGQGESSARESVEWDETGTEGWTPEIRVLVIE